VLLFVIKNNLYINNRGPFRRCFCWSFCKIVIIWLNSFKLLVTAICLLIREAESTQVVFNHDLWHDPWLPLQLLNLRLPRYFDVLYSLLSISRKLRSNGLHCSRLNYCFVNKRLSSFILCKRQTIGTCLWQLLPFYSRVSTAIGQIVIINTAFAEHDINCK